MLSGPLAIVFDECYGCMLDAKTRRDALDTAITELAGSEPYVDVVRRTGKSLAVRAQADRSARRLHGRWHALEARGKPRTMIVVAVVRHQPAHMSRVRVPE